MHLLLLTLTLWCVEASLLSKQDQSAFYDVYGPPAARYTPDWTSLDARPLPSWYDEVRIPFTPFYPMGIKNYRFSGEIRHFHPLGGLFRARVRLGMVLVVLARYMS